MKTADVSVLIPTCGRPSSLIRCLDHLQTDTGFEVIVSDDANAEETRQAVERAGFRVTVIQGPRRGPAANRNCAAAQASGELLVFLDDDCVPESNLIDTYLEEANNAPEISVFEGRISATGKMRGFADVAPDNEDGGHLWSCNFAIRRALFEKVGGFDERFRFAANEDMDLYLRVLKHSSVKFLRNARVYHAWERRAGAKPLRHKGLSSILFMNLHPRGTTCERFYSYLRAAARTLIYGFSQHLGERALADPAHLLRRVGYDLKLAVVALFWRWRGMIVPLLFRPCCEGCNEMVEMLREPRDQWEPTSKV